jgi:hypothetical protein
LWHFRTQESRSGTSSEVVCTSSFSIFAFSNHVYTIYYGILNVNLPSTTLLHAETTCKIDNIASTVRDYNKLRTSRTPPWNQVMTTTRLRDVLFLSFASLITTWWKRLYCSAIDSRRSIIL